MSRNLRAIAAPTTGAETREAILDAARQLFVAQGYDATSLRQIAEAVGTTKAALYYYFPAKEHLLLELTRPMLDALSNLLTVLRERGEDPADAEWLLEQYLDLFLAHQPMLHLMARDPATQDHPDVGNRIRTLVEAIGRHLAGPDATAEQVTRATCALGVVHAVAALPQDVAQTQHRTILTAAMATLGVSPTSGEDRRE